MTMRTEPLAVVQHAAPLGGNRLVAAINRVLEGLSIVLMTALAALVFLNAASRYALSAPLPWTEEVVICLLVWLAALGIVMPAMRGVLICCDVVTQRLTATNQKVLRRGCLALGAGVMLYCAWLTCQYLLLFGADRSPVVGVPKAVVISAVLLAVLGIAASLIVALFRREEDRPC